MSRRRIAPALVVLVTALAAAGCVPHAYQSHLRRGDDAAAIAAFEADSAAQRSPRALRAVARLHADPASTAWDPRRALELYLRAEAAGGPPARDLRRETRLLEAYLLAEQRGTEAVAAAVASRDSLQVAIDEVVARLSVAGDSLVARSAEVALLRTLMARLEEDLRVADAQLQAARTELAALKQIDLRSEGPLSGGTAARP